LIARETENLNGYFLDTGGFETFGTNSHCFGGAANLDLNPSEIRLPFSFG
jgi:hypothetical protein